MKNFAAACALLTALVIATPGCYKTLDDRSRAGVPFKKDRIGGQYERSIDQVQVAARKVLQFNGTLTADDIVNRVLVGKIDTRTVYVRLTELEPNLTSVLVQARTKGGGADVDLAAEIDKQIAINLR
ncbi:MAG: hypothetical protein JNK85_07925 [Verrucomicrobiales bacterium]|nr:hypothetical protein [Verrucomicrobiales bacterium]